MSCENYCFLKYGIETCVKEVQTICKLICCGVKYYIGLYNKKTYGFKYFLVV